MFRINYNYVLAGQYTNVMLDKVDAVINIVLQPGFKISKYLGRGTRIIPVEVVVDPQGFTRDFLCTYRKNKMLKPLLGGDVSYLRSLIDMVRMDSPEHFVKLTKRKYDRCYAGKSSFEDFHTIMTYIFVENGYEKKGFVNNDSIIDGIGLKVCPYCGQTYIGRFKYKRENGTMHVAKAQIDHFFPKGQYPFLALSYANFIPSCPACNMSHKHIEDVVDSHGLMKLMSPYEFEESKFKFVFGLKKAGYMDENHIGVKTVFKNATQEDNALKIGYQSILGLDKLYEYHNDIVMDILIKKAIEQTSQLLYYKRGVGIDDAFLNRYITAIYGYEPDPKSDKHRIMSKFIRDIVKQVDEIIRLANNAGRK